VGVNATIHRDKEESSRPWRTAVGPDWLQVSFREGGAEAPFVVDPRGPYGVYYVATELPGQAGFHRLKDLPQKVFRVHPD
jgi:hypothetical protein